MDKEHIAMQRLQTASEMSLSLYGLPLMLTDIGGKDSAVICRLAENAGIPFEIVHSHTTADAPETVRHVRKRAKEFEAKGIKYEIVMPTYKGELTSMWKLIPQKKMPPTRIVRYCCSVLKETAGAGRFIATGVRWEESTKRKNSRGILEVNASKVENRIILNNDNDEDRRLFETCMRKSKRTVNPIVDWSEADVWDYLNDQKVECNPLYCEGRRRVGCVGCPMAGKHRSEEFAIWPKFKQMYINSFDRMVLARIAAGLLTMWRNGNDVFHWWIEDGVLPGQMGFEDMEDMEELE